jgi:hypothetical protein
MTTTCKRCAKEYSGATCPYCTVTGVDLDALLSAEEMKLLRHADHEAKVSLVDMVSGKPLAVTTPVCKIGRDSANDITLAGDRSMSRFHFQIRQTGQDYYIEDCGSRNGTFLNGSPIAIPRKLHHGDIVSAGISRYQFFIQAEGGALPAGTGSEGEKSAASAQPAPGGILTPEEISEAREALQKLRGTVEEPAQGEERHSEETTENVIPPELTRPDDDEEALIDTSASVPMAPRVEEPAARAVPSPGPIDQSSPPAWLDEYLFPEIQKLMSEKERLNGLLEEIRQDIKQIDRRIASAQSISQALLSASGPELGQAAKQVFDSLDWFGELSAGNPFEITLKTAPKIDAVVKIVVCQSEPGNRDFEALVNQQAVVWCQSNYEPKGIMVVQVRPETPPSQRPPLSREFLENMRRKKICVVQPTQLLAIYRLVALGGHEKNYFKDLFLTTCGPLSGFMMKPQGDRAATA